VCFFEGGIVLFLSDEIIREKIFEGLIGIIVGMSVIRRDEMRKELESKVVDVLRSGDESVIEVKGVDISGRSKKVCVEGGGDVGGECVGS